MKDLDFHKLDIDYSRFPKGRFNTDDSKLIKEEPKQESKEEKSQSTVEQPTRKSSPKHIPIFAQLYGEGQELNPYQVNDTITDEEILGILVTGSPIPKSFYYLSPVRLIKLVHLIPVNEELPINLIYLISRCKWIDVDTYLPANSEEVSLLAMTDMGYVFEALYYNNKFHCMEVRNNKCYFDSDEMHDCITHWMYTPTLEP
jgi:hypothetical protein